MTVGLNKTLLKLFSFNFPVFTFSVLKNVVTDMVYLSVEQNSLRPTVFVFILIFFFGLFNF